MLLNYLKVFLRLFARNRIFTLINLLGLSAGIACFFLIRLYVSNEKAYDRHLPCFERTYRLAMKGDMSGFSFEAAVMGGPFAQAIREDVPEVGLTTTFYKLPRPVLMSRGEQRFYEESILYVDTAFLDFFGYTSILGDPVEMLRSPHSMVLTRSGAEKYFGQQNPVGKVITWNNRQDYTVTGIIEDPVLNSHLNFDILASYSTLLEQDPYRSLLTTFYAFVTYNYLRLENSSDRKTVEEKISGVVEKHMGEGMRESGSHFELFLQPVGDIHLNSSLVHELEANGSRSSVLIFSAISFLILLIACVNFINLTTARSAGRVREIGLRQASGAGRSRLFRQFMIESVLFAICSVILAVFLIELASPWFFNFSGINKEALQVQGFMRILQLLLLGVIVGVISGLYPSFFLSRIKPGWLVRGSIRKNPTRPVLRNILVIVQLGITLFLVFNTILIYKQLRLINRVDIGINKDDLIVMPLRGQEMPDQYEVIKKEMLTLPAVKDVTAFSAYLGSFEQRRGFYVEGFDRQDLWMLHHIQVTPDYPLVMETGLVMGRFFRPGSVADSSAVIINTAMMKQAGWEDPIGKRIIMPDRGREREYRVIGMVEDFNYTTIHKRVESLLIMNNVQGIRYLGIRVQDAADALAAVGEKWESLFPAYPFDYFFQEDYYDNLYKEDRNMGSLFIYFTILAILISVLGLFGLVLFTASRRIREIGIRKALGGEIPGLVLLLLREYPVLIILASALALPASWYFARQWLGNFAEQTDISSWIYVISVILVLVICLGTSIIQTLRTARANPVSSLRYE